jgi:hypothetical protein
MITIPTRWGTFTLGTPEYINTQNWKYIRFYLEGVPTTWHIIVELAKSLVYFWFLKFWEGLCSFQFFIYSMIRIGFFILIVAWSGYFTDIQEYFFKKSNIVNIFNIYYNMDTLVYINRYLKINKIRWSNYFKK